MPVDVLLVIDRSWPKALIDRTRLTIGLQMRIWSPCFRRRAFPAGPFSGSGAPTRALIRLQRRLLTSNCRPITLFATCRAHCAGTIFSRIW